MKKIILLISAAVMALSLASCGSAEKMAKQAESVIVECNPSPLTVKGGQVTADLTVSYPKGYFNKKAILEVTPVIVYDGGECAIDPLMYQGEKVKNNYKVVPAAGGTVKETVTFPYKEGMAQSKLELRGRATTNSKKWVAMPTKKVADGCNITETLASNKGYYAPKDHGYQAIINMAPEGQVMYRINSAEVRSSELKSTSVKDFQEALKEIAANDRKALKNIEIVAYASPDGSEALNDKLSNNRSKTADKAFGTITKKEDSVKGVAKNVKSVGEDWEGFQEMVTKSNVEDKDLILRVLGMYSDANVREREIKNMASIYQDLAKDVLPQLRRARFIANVEFTNYTEEELVKLVKDDIEILDEPALLKAATLFKDPAQKKALYNKAVSKYNSEKAKYDLACVALCEDNVAEAKKQLVKCESNDPDVINLAGVIAFRNGDIKEAQKCFALSKTPDAVKNQGLCALISGDYATAVAKCGDKGTDAAVARLMNGNVAGALAACGDCKCPKANYIRAICYARQGKVSDAKAALKKATDADAALAKRAETDIEFATIR